MVIHIDTQDCNGKQRLMVFVAVRGLVIMDMDRTNVYIYRALDPTMIR